MREAHPWPHTPELSGRTTSAKALALAGRSDFRDEWKVRVTGLDAEGDAQTLHVRPVPYHAYLATNLAVALEESVREALVPAEASLALSPASACSNHLGVSALLVTHDRAILLPYSSDAVASSPGDLVPSVSGSADWPLGPDGSPDPEGASRLELHTEVVREYAEELAPRQERGARAVLGAWEDLEAVVPLGWCQNLERGGKPEAFFLLFSRRDAEWYAKVLRGGRDEEHGDRAFEVLPSPFESATRLRSPRAVRASVGEVTALADRPDLNGILRASVVLLLEHLQRLRPSTG